jgi:hypothetical protein
LLKQKFEVRNKVFEDYSKQNRGEQSGNKKKDNTKERNKPQAVEKWPSPIRS